MRKEVILPLLKKKPFIPFKFITKKGSVLNVINLISYSDTDFEFVDIKQNIVVQEYTGIDCIYSSEV